MPAGIRLPIRARCYQKSLRVVFRGPAGGLAALLVLVAFMVFLLMSSRLLSLADYSTVVLSTGPPHRTIAVNASGRLL